MARFCAVADELNDRIYMVGGATTARRKLCKYYRVSTNSWHGCNDGTLNYNAYVRCRFCDTSLNNLYIGLCCVHRGC